MKEIPPHRTVQDKCNQKALDKQIMNETRSTVRENTLGGKAIFGIVCGAHFINHLQSAMLGVIYPLMMKELVMGYMAIASLAAVYNTLGNVFQSLYGFIVPYGRRQVILWLRHGV